MEIVEGGLYRIQAVAPFERGEGHTLRLYVDAEPLRSGWDSQSGRAQVSELKATAVECLRAGQVVTALLDGDPIPPDQLTVERIDGP